MNYFMEEEQLIEMQADKTLRDDAEGFAKEALRTGGNVVITQFDEPLRRFTSVLTFESFWKERLG